METKHDETVPGGRYIMGDRYVDAEGKEIGKVKAAEMEIDAETEAEKAAPKKTK